MSDGFSRIGRTVLQLIAAGGLTALFEQITLDLPEPYNVYFPLIVAFLVTTLQNVLEDRGAVPALLKPDVVDRHEANIRITHAKLGDDPDVF